MRRSDSFRKRHSVFHCSTHDRRRAVSRRKAVHRRSLLPMGSLLVTLGIREVEEQCELLSYAVSVATTRVYLYLTGPLATAAPVPTTLDFLAHCYDEVALLKPTLDLVPLFPSVGWTPERVAELEDVEELVTSPQQAQQAEQLLDAVNTARQRLQQPPISLTLTHTHLADVPTASAATQQPKHAPHRKLQQQQQGQQRQQDERAQEQGEGQCSSGGGEGSLPQRAASPSHQSRVLGGWEGPLAFRKVAVGGTFDRLHAGHRLLLAATALVAAKHIFVGVTAQKLLQNKKGRELLEPYDVRAAAAERYMREVHPGVDVHSGPLNDPNEPPIAATDPEFDGIVVSEETIPGAEAINDVRAERGFPPLAVVVVGLIASNSPAAKLSSTDLRLKESQQAGSSQG